MERFASPTGGAEKVSKGLGYVFKLLLLLSGFVGLVFYYGYVCLYTCPS